MSYQDDHFQDNTLDLEDRLEAHILELETFLNLSVIEEFNLDNEDNTEPKTSMSESNPAPSVDPVLKGIFGNSTALTAAQLASSLTSNKKEDRKGMDPQTLHRTRNTATRTLDKTFKVQTALGTSGVVGEENPDLETSEIAVIFSKNTHVVDKLARVLKEYDMTSAIEMHLVIDVNKTHPTEKYGTSTVDLLQNIGEIDIEAVKEYSGDIMLYDMPGEDGVHRQNQEWLLRLIRNNVSSSIAALIEPVFDKLKPKHQNGSVYLKLVLDLVFMIDDNVIKALQDYIRRFGKNGLMAFEGENVNMAAIEIVSIARRLDQLNKLPTDAPKDVLKGLMKVTHNIDFKKTFEMIHSFENQTCIAIAGAGPKGTPLENILRYFKQAQTFYTSAVLRSKWLGKKPSKQHSQHNATAPMVVKCWNCGGDHRLGDCKEQLNQATIDKNKKTFYENKKKNSEVRGGSGSERGGPKQDYQRSGFGKGSGASTNGVMVTSDGAVYTQCKHGSSVDGCGLNKTHSSKYHAQWKANKSTFQLPKTHPFMVALAKGNQCLPCNNNDGQKSVGNLQAAITSALHQFKAEQHQKLCTLETQSPDLDISHAAGLLKSLFQ